MIRILSPRRVQMTVISRPSITPVVAQRASPCRGRGRRHDLAAVKQQGGAEEINRMDAQVALPFLFVPFKCHYSHICSHNQSCALPVAMGRRKRFSHGSFGRTPSADYSEKPIGDGKSTSALA